MSGEDHAAALGGAREDVARSRAEGEARRALERLVMVPWALHDASLREGVRPDRHLAAIIRIDDETRALLRPLVFARLPSSVGREAVATAREAFGALLDAYRACAMSYRSGTGGHPGNEAEECRVRLVRAAADRVKWERCAGGPAHRQLWHWIANEFRDVVAGAASGGDARGSSFGATGVAREYLRAVTHATLPLDRLDLVGVETVDRLVEFSLPMIQFQPAAVHSATYYSSPDFASAPRRIVRPGDGGPAAWHFSAQAAAKVIDELAGRPGSDPQLREFAGRMGNSDIVREALRFLQMQWSHTVPSRRFRRHLLDGRLQAVRGIDELRRAFSGEARPRATEWTFHDASRGGLGVFARLQDDSPIRVGELVGIGSAAGDAFQLAVVRRAWVETDTTTFVDLETLSQSPTLVSADDGRSRASVFLCDPIHRGETVRVLVATHALRAGVPLFVTGRGVVQKLRSLGAGMHGEGFELFVYQVL